MMDDGIRKRKHQLTQDGTKSVTKIKPPSDLLGLRCSLFKMSPKSLTENYVGVFSDEPKRWWFNFSSALELTIILC